jgi:geranylgeranyl diphosphate synthase type I
MSALKSLSGLMLPVIENELQRAIDQTHAPNLSKMRYMLAYHMGWEGEGAGAEARGKRVRPLLTLLCAMAAGGDWEKALPGAAAVELVHNFSLLHDDIQDESPTRRGRRTVWTIWGVAQAINAGDALFALAQLIVLDLGEKVSTEAGLLASRVLQQTCLHLTQGQFLDLSYEERTDLKVHDYWPMVGGKTAALLSASTQIGALAAQADTARIESYRRFGELLGLAFQVQDDLLGIWGDAALTGKSTASDLVSGKKSLPVLYGLGINGNFAQRWTKGSISADEVKNLADLLEAEGGRAFVEQEADRLTNNALESLREARPEGEAKEALEELAEYLLKRKL